MDLYLIDIVNATEDWCVLLVHAESEPDMLRAVSEYIAEHPGAHPTGVHAIGGALRNAVIAEIGPGAQSAQRATRQDRPSPPKPYQPPVKLPTEPDGQT